MKNHPASMIETWYKTMKSMLKRSIGGSNFFFLMFLFTSAFPQNKTEYAPQFSGYVKAWYQADFSTNNGQYLVKQARFNIAGDVNEYAGYKFQVDFTRLGRLSSTTTTVGGERVVNSVSANFSDILLDAAAIFKPVTNLEITGGQFKIPYSTESLRSDQNLAFANRPLQTGVSPSSRDIGLMVSYKIKNDISAEFSAGSFNGAGLNKTENDKTTDYVLRAAVSLLKDFNVSGNYYVGKNQGLDLNYLNGGIDYKIGQLFLDAEFSNKVMENPQSDITGISYFAFATYDLALPGDFLKFVIPGIRYEMLDPGTSVDNNEITRITMGLTFHFAKINFALFRINYEKFDYKDGSSNPDKLILELQTRF